MEVDVVAGLGVHEYAHGTFGRGVHHEVHVDVGGRWAVGVLLFDGCGCRLPFLPYDELLVGDGGIIDEEGVLQGCDVAVDVDVVALHGHVDGTGGIDGSEERLVGLAGACEVGEVVGQQLVGLYLEVEAQVGEVLVVDAAGEIGHVVVLVVDGQRVEQYLVIDHRDGVLSDLVGGVECREGGFAVYAQSSGQVDGREWSCQSQFAVAVSGNV